MTFLQKSEKNRKISSVELNWDSSGTKVRKVGTASCESILGLVAQGEASIEAAKKDGGITNVHHVDWDARNVLGIYGKYTVTVYGE